MFYLRHPSLFFYTSEPYPAFCLLSVLIFITLNKHSIMIANTSDDSSLDDKTVVVSYNCINKSETFNLMTLPCIRMVIN